jgi:hypothetical protein
MNLLQKILALFNPTVDSLIGDIQKRVNKLDGVLVRKMREAAAHTDAIKRAEVARDAAVAEATRADRLAAKFAALIN